MSKAAAIMLIILGVVLLFGVVLGVYVLLESTNYFKCKPTDFWITAQDTRYNSDADELVFKDTAIGVHYLVGWLSGKQGYTYKIVPVGHNFEYTVDGVTYNYLDIEDLTDAFEIVERKDGIIIKANNKRLDTALQSLYPNGDVNVPTSRNSGFTCKLIITAVDGKTVALTFRCSVAVEGIELDPPSVVF